MLGQLSHSKEDALPSAFPFPTKKVTSRRQLVRIGLEESDVEKYGCEDNSDDPEATNEAGPSSRTTEKSVEAQGEVSAQLEAAKDANK